MDQGETFIKKITRISTDKVICGEGLIIRRGGRIGVGTTNPGSIGEAARYVPENIKNKHMAIPWKKIIRTRDRLRHGYFDINPEIIFEIVTNDLPHIIENVPAGVCKQCGEKYVNTLVSSQIDKIIQFTPKKVSRKISVPILDLSPTN